MGILIGEVIFMCGIIGCNGVESAVPVLINGLKKMEYRGYDSSGIAVLCKGKTVTEKKKGRVAALVKELERKANSEAQIGIGHTRWATHGEPSDENAHPHQSGKFTLVHNGIIENHTKLKEQYLKLTAMKSGTDTEVAVHLLNRFCSDSCLEAIAHTAKQLEGSFAFAVMYEDEPEKLFCVRQASPLVVGLGEGTFAASDTAAISENIHTLYRMNDGEIAVLEKDRISFYDFELNRITKTPDEFEKSSYTADKGSCEHFMLKEIYEQPEAIRRTVEAYLNENSFDLGLKPAKPERIFIVACGSAYHAGLVGRRVFETLAKIPVSVETASEFRYSEPLVNEETPVIIISQSGETADSLAALREAKKRGAKTLSIVNVKESTIASESDFVLLTRAGPEIAVATTKAYGAQLSALYLLGIYFAESFGTADKNELEEMKKALNDLHKSVSAALNCEEQIKEIAHRLKGIDRAYFIGRGAGFAAASEGSLKLKEISYIHCEAYAAGEMKHGTISLIEKDTTVIAMNTQTALAHKLQSNIDEVRSRGARVIAVTSADSKINADETITLPEVHPLFAVSTQIVPVQLLSYHIARLRGCDIDKPRNLAKSVTVE